jgi:hypothetical protein
VRIIALENQEWVANLVGVSQADWIRNEGWPVRLTKDKDKMKTITKEYGNCGDRAALLGQTMQVNRLDDGSFETGERYRDPRHRSLLENMIARNGWEIVEPVTDNPPFNAVIAVKATMATAGPDGQWAAQQGMLYYLAELKSIAAPD